jgi:acetyl esterase
MSLTPASREEIVRIIEAPHKVQPTPVYPQRMHDFMKLSDAEDVTLNADKHKFLVTVYKAKNRRPNCPVHINIHGGAFFFPHAENDSMFSSYLASLIEGIVVDIDYTLSSVASWPVPFDQCYATVPFVLDHCAEWDADESRISMGGYSAGATYTAGVALKSAMTSDFKLCLEVLGYPPLDFVIADKYKMEGFNRTSASLVRGEAINDLFFDGETQALGSNPFISPLYADDSSLAKVPRTLICTASTCNFRFEDEEYGLKLASLGVEVTLKRFPGTRHGFIPHFYEGWEEATNLIAHTIKVAR